MIPEDVISVVILLAASTVAVATFILLETRSERREVSSDVEALRSELRELMREIKELRKEIVELRRELTEEP